MSFKRQLLLIVTQSYQSLPLNPSAICIQHVMPPFLSPQPIVIKRKHNSNYFLTQLKTRKQEFQKNTAEQATLYLALRLCQAEGCFSASKTPLTTKTSTLAQIVQTPH